VLFAASILKASAMKFDTAVLKTGISVYGGGSVIIVRKDDKIPLDSQDKGGMRSMCLKRTLSRSRWYRQRCESVLSGITEALHEGLGAWSGRSLCLLGKVIS
jgi:hypothetical protein